MLCLTYMCGQNLCLTVREKMLINTIHSGYSATKVKDGKCHHAPNRTSKYSALFHSSFPPIYTLYVCVSERQREWKLKVEELRNACGYRLPSQGWKSLVSNSVQVFGHLSSTMLSCKLFINNWFVRSYVNKQTFCQVKSVWTIYQSHITASGVNGQ